MAVALLHGGVLPSLSGEALPKPLLYTHITTRSQRGSTSRFDLCFEENAWVSSHQYLLLEKQTCMVPHTV